MDNEIKNNNAIDTESLKQWFTTITDPKQQAIVVNLKILKLETYVKDRNFAKQEYEESLKKIEEVALVEVLKDETLTNEQKRKSALKKSLESNGQYKELTECIEAIKQDIAATEINISFYKRTFQILITFANEWVKA